jgi:type II secretory pathway pseudopilin PulG
LTELAIVLVIVGLLLASLMPSLTAQTDQRHYSETTQTMHEIRDALLGYAVAHSAADGKPLLPCPDTDDDGMENRTGNDCTSDEGRIPWSDLGVTRWDSWNNRIRYRVTKDFSRKNIGITLASTGDLRICPDAACTTTLASSVPAVLVSHGKNGLGAFNAIGGINSDPTGADELVNKNTGDKDFVSHAPAPDFDDVVVWLPTTILLNRMVVAGRLP